MPDFVLLTPRAPQDAAAWQALWARAEARSPFTHVRFVEALSESTGYRPLLVGVEDGGRLVAGAVVYARGRAAWRAGPAPLTRYTGVLLDPPVREGHVLERRSALDVLLAGLQARFRVAGLSLVPGQPDARALAWRGAVVTPRYTYRLPADVPYQPARNVRQHLRKDDGLHYVAAAAPAEAASALLLSHSQRGLRPPAAPAALAEALAVLLDAGLAYVHAAASGDRLVGAQAVLQDDAWAYAWIGGSAPGPAMTMLMDAAMRRAQASTLGFDLVGANTPAVAHFKKGFGGRLVPHFHAVLHRSRLLRAVHAVRPLA